MQSDPQISTVTDLLKKSQGTLFGKYRGVVKQSDDPEKMGRLKLEIPSVFGTAQTDWVPGAFAFGGSSKEGMIFIPAVGSHVLVEFIEGDKSSPIWTATYYPVDGSTENGAMPPDTFDLDQGHLHTIKTEGGLEVRMEDNRKAKDDGGEQRFVINHPRETEIIIDVNGTITITDAEGGSVMMDPENKIVRIDGHGPGQMEMVDDKLTVKHGNSTSMVLDSSGVTISGGAIKLDGDSVALGKNATAPVMNAQAFVTEFIAHAHTSVPAGGPTSPPAPPKPTLLQSVSFSKVTGA